jgi:hypothetical protein
MATRTVAGIYREVWESNAQDGGVVQVVPTNIRCRLASITRIKALCIPYDMVGSPKFDGTVSIVNDHAVVTITNQAAAGNSAKWTLDIQLLRSPDQGQEWNGVTVPVLIPNASALDVSTALADWGLDVIRHFVIDSVNGLDTNVGYVDAPLGAVSINTVGVPVRSQAKLMSLIPRAGAGRLAIIHFANNDFSTGEVYPDMFDQSGIGGYGYFLKRGWSAWLDQSLYPCWSYRDRDISGARIALPGPNPDGSWTVNTVDVVGILKMTNLAGGAALADDAATLFRVRFSGNVTAGMRDMRAPIYKSYADTIELEQDPTDRDWNVLIPVAGDTFWIECPGVRLTGGYRETNGAFGAIETIDNHDLPGAANITVGLDFASSGSGTIWLGSVHPSCRYVWCMQGAVSTNTYLVSASNAQAILSFQDGYSTPGSTTDESTWSPTRFAAKVAIRCKELVWGTGFGCTYPPGAEVNHGTFGAAVDRITAEWGGVFLGGLSLAAKSGVIGNYTLNESFTRIMRIVRVLETASGLYNSIVGGELTVSGVFLDDAILKLGDSTDVPVGMNVLIANLIGGPTVNAQCGATGKKTAIFCRAIAADCIQIGFQNGTGVPTATGIDGDVYLYLDGNIVPYTDLVKGAIDSTGTRWFQARSMYGKYYGAAPPVAGTYRVGDVFITTTPTSGNPYMWVCTNVGPLTWTVAITLA